MSKLDSPRRMALAIHEAGLCTVPPRQDGSKAPIGAWKRYQSERPNTEQIEAWYSDGDRTGVGVVCGAISNGLLLFEFEARAVEAGLLDKFLKEAPADLKPLLDRIGSGWWDKSASGGWHAYLLVPEPRTMKLALDSDRSVLVETKGEGGYSICAPSHGSVHPSGKAWVRGPHGPEAIQRLTAEEHQALITYAQTFDRSPTRTTNDDWAERLRTTNERPQGLPTGNGWLPQVVADYNARTSWSEVLAGVFEHVHDSGNVDYWRFIGQEGKVGATTNAKGTDTLIVFSGTAEGQGWEVWAGTGHAPSYDRFSAHCFITQGRNDQGTRTELAKDLQREGYGPAFEQSTKSDLVVQAPAPQREWPKLDPEALHGPVGEAVRIITPETEADPAAMLATMLTGLGAMIGSGPHVVAGHAPHAARLFVMIAGDTASGGKGTSLAAARLVLDRVDPDFMSVRSLGGFGSGEAMVDAVGDGDPLGEGGAPDKRLLMIEQEYSRTLRAASRDGSTLSLAIRQAWDGSKLESRSRAKTTSATGHHICVVGHIVPDELRRYTTSTDTAGGSANRFLYLCSKRSKLLAHGGADLFGALTPTVKVLQERITASRRIGAVGFTPAGYDRWSELYNVIERDTPGGLLGSTITRGSPHTLRIALLFALLDGERQIDDRHLNAAHALWRYSRDSAAYLFGDSTGDPIAERILEALKPSPDGLSLTELDKALGKHIPAVQRDQAISLLLNAGKVTTEQQQTAGRSITRLRAIHR